MRKKDRDTGVKANMVEKVVGSGSQGIEGRRIEVADVHELIVFDAKHL